MDPLSVTASVVGIGGAVATVVKGLKDIADKLSRSNLTLLSLCSESSSVHVALGQIESIFRRHEQEMLQRFEDQPALASAFDTTLTGCAMLYSCLESEVHDLRSAVRKDGTLDWSSKFKVAWKQDDMERLAGQIRGQSAALNLLLQGLQTESIFDLQRMMRSQGNTMTLVQDTTRSLREKYPDSEVPESILGARKTAESVFGAVSGPDTAVEFSFDDVIVNSKAYRRALALAEAQIQGKVQLDVERMQGNARPETPTNLAQTQDGAHFDIENGEKTRLADDAPARPASPDSAMSWSKGDDEEGAHNTAPITSISYGMAAEPESLQRYWKKPLSPETSQPTGARTPHLHWKEPLPFNIPWSEEWSLWSRIGYSSDWATTFDLRPQDWISQPKRLIEMQNVFWEIFTTEYDFITAARTFVRSYKTQHRWSNTSNSSSHLWERFGSIFDGLIEIAEVHEKLIYQPLWRLWDSEGAFAEFSAEPFLTFITEGGSACSNYFKQFPLAFQLVALQAKTDGAYRLLLDDLRSDRASNRLPWDSFFKGPIMRVQRYSLLLKVLAKNAEKIKRPTIPIEVQKVLEPLSSAVGEWNDGLEAADMAAKTDITMLQFADDSLPAHRMIARGYFPCRLDQTSSWTWLQVILRAGDLLLARETAQRPHTDRGTLATVATEDSELQTGTALHSLQLVGRLAIGWGSCTMSVESSVKLNAFSRSRGEMPSGTKLYPLRFDDNVNVYKIAFLGDARTGVKTRDNYYREDWYDLIDSMLRSGK